jgi:TfoX/Sxy family transcriptional regulator of competence genes
MPEVHEEEQAECKGDVEAGTARITSAMSGHHAAVPKAQLRKMFGYPAALVNGNMVAGVFQDSRMLHVAKDDRPLICSKASAKPFEPMPGRVMGEYMVVPDAILKSTAQLEAWVP